MLATVSAVVFLAFFVREISGAHANPYFGMVTLLVWPAFFAVGLLLIPLGILRARRRSGLRAAPVSPGSDWPTIDLRSASARRIAAIALTMTVVNVSIVALASYQSLEFVDSTCRVARRRLRSRGREPILTLTA